MNNEIEIVETGNTGATTFRVLAQCKTLKSAKIAAKKLHAQVIIHEAGGRGCNERFLVAVRT